jgi:hypothetical protein
MRRCVSGDATFKLVASKGEGLNFHTQLTCWGQIPKCFSTRAIRREDGEHDSARRKRRRELACFTVLL